MLRVMADMYQIGQDVHHYSGSFSLNIIKYITERVLLCSGPLHGRLDPYLPPALSTKPSSKII